MVTYSERQKAKETIARELHESGYSENEVHQIIQVIDEEYNDLPFGWIDLVDAFVERGRTRKEALNIIYLSFKSLRHSEVE